jgi:hypothetical protein
MTAIDAKRHSALAPAPWFVSEAKAELGAFSAISRTLRTPGANGMLFIILSPLAFLWKLKGFHLVSIFCLFVHYGLEGIGS